MDSKKFIFTLAVFAAMSVYSCQKDALPGSAAIEITDAPIDDANVKAAFITISNIKVDGKSVDGFTETTFDVSAYQDGATKLLCIAGLDAQSYSEITLVMDYEFDQNGNAPGCYVEEMDGTKHQLLASSKEITIDHDFMVESETQTTLVIDFDLRKVIARESDAADHYEFATNAEMESGIRIVTKSETGVIHGNFSDLVSNSDKVVVYAYKKGAFNRSAEMKGQGTSNIEFANAVSSAAVDAGGNFELHFLEAGDYEIVFASYEESPDGEMALKGTLSLNVLGSIDLSDITVGASGSVTVDVVVTGILP